MIRNFVSIELLNITDFRNITAEKIQCAPHFNFFYGDNAAGKTSLLEAIYYLSTGKSFQTSAHETVIQNNKNDFVLFARLNSKSATTEIGLQRFRNGSRHIHIDGASVKSIAELSARLPLQFIGANSYTLLTDGPRARREFIDWGLFHTNPRFFPAWKQFQKLLTQRNAALKTQTSYAEMKTWNNELARAGEVLHTLRTSYLIDFNKFFIKILFEFFKNQLVTIRYEAGWDENVALLDLLEKNLQREYKAAHTLFGPHRADLCLEIDGLPAIDRLSQGQQKMISYALKLAQGLHFNAITQQPPVYLIDDLPSELDFENQKRVIYLLENLQAQVFITAISMQDLLSISSDIQLFKMFHVKHGVILEKNKLECFT